MSIQIGDAPSSDFSNPLGLLSDCHRRIERFLVQLTAVVREATDGHLTESALAALEQALRYFRSAAPLHTADEEQSLFPRLRSAGTPDAYAAIGAVEALEADHRSADSDHAEVDRLGVAWIEAGHLSPANREQLLGALNRLQTLYLRHIAVEDRQIFPLAGRSLRPETLAVIGREMAERRGLDPDAPTTESRCTARHRRSAGDE